MPTFEQKIGRGPLNPEPAELAKDGPFGLKMRKSPITHVILVGRFFQVDIRNQRQKLYQYASFQRIPTNFKFQAKVQAKILSKNQLSTKKLKSGTQVQLSTLIPNIDLKNFSTNIT